MVTDRCTDIHADTQNDYRNPCACAPRIYNLVNIASMQYRYHTQAPVLLLDQDIVGVYDIILIGWVEIKSIGT